MAEDWAPGDLALCVNASGWCENTTFTDRSGPARGSICTVADVAPPEFGHPMLELAEWGQFRLYWGGGFRKINPLSEAEYEAAMQELLAPPRRKPARAGAR